MRRGEREGNSETIVRQLSKKAACSLWGRASAVRSGHRWCTLHTLGVSSKDLHNHVRSWAGNHLVNVSAAFLGFLCVRHSEVARKYFPCLVCSRVYRIKNQQKLQGVYDGCLLINMVFVVSVALCGLFKHYRMAEIWLMNWRTVAQMSYSLPVTRLIGLKVVRTDDLTSAWLEPSAAEWFCSL